MILPSQRDCPTILENLTLIGSPPNLNIGARHLVIGSWHSAVGGWRSEQLPYQLGLTILSQPAGLLPSLSNTLLIDVVHSIFAAFYLRRNTPGHLPLRSTPASSLGG